MAVRDDRSDVKQTTAGFRGPLMVQSLTSAKSKFLSLINIHSAATRPVRIRAGFFIVSSSTGILETLDGLGKGKEEG